MKWYSFETMFTSLKDGLRAFLKMHDIRYELSGMFKGYHFEIYASADDVRAINNYLDSVCICEQR